MGILRLRTISVLTILCIAPAILFAGITTDYTDAALRKLSTATKRQQNGQHLANLSALRNLQDPALRPFFYKLAQHNNWKIQVHAILGISELSDDGLVDPWLVQQVAPLAREQLVSISLRDDLLTTEQMKSLLGWSLLEPAPTLMLTAELHNRGVKPTSESIERLINNTDLGIATIATLISENPTLIEEVTNRLRRSTTREKEVALAQTLQIIQQYEWSSGKQWLLSLLDSDTLGLSDIQLQQTLFTLLQLDPELGMDCWRNALPSEPTKLEQVRYLLLLMEAEIELDESIAKLLNISSEDGLPYDLFILGSTTTDKLIDGKSYIDALLDLANRGHSKSTQWTFRRASNLPTDLSEEFYATLSLLPEGNQANNVRRRDISIMAFHELINLDAVKAWKLLREAEDDSNQQELMLLAMLQHRGDELLTKEASSIRRIGIGRPDAMALLLAARGTDPITDSDQRLLGLIAASGAAIESSLETQAAWLYLRRMGMTDQALAAATTNSP
ncbi:hypothetical protein H8D29_00870 [PVC group bacterium]|nr:hypothetical protein [PVC group bacterium]